MERMLKHLCMWNLRGGKQAVAHTAQNSSGDLKGLRNMCLNNPHWRKNAATCLRRSVGMQAGNNLFQLLGATTINWNQ